MISDQVNLASIITSDSSAQARLLSANNYVQATPLPHIVIDNFLPEDLIANICSNYPVEPTANEMLYERGYKGQHKRQISPNECTPYLKAVFNAFNSAPMLQFLEN